MQHINLSNYKGSITDWTELNYINGGLADNLADIANIKVNDSCYNYIANSQNLVNISDKTISSPGYIFNIPVNNLKTTTTYTCSFNWTGGGSLQFRALKNNNNVGSDTINDVPSGRNSITITTTDTPDTIYLYANNSNGGTASNIMINEGNVPTAYEPYGALVIHQNANKIIVTNTTSYTWMSPSFKNATIRLDAPYKAPNVPYKVRWQGNDNILTIGAEINGNMYISFKNAYANETELRNDMVGVIVWYELATPIVIPVINHTFTGSEAFALSSRAIVTDGTNSYIRVYLSNSFAIDKTKLDFGMAELPTQPYRYWTDAIATEYVSIDETNGNMLFCINTKKAGTTLATAVQWLTGKVLQYTSTE